MMMEGEAGVSLQVPGIDMTLPPPEASLSALDTHNGSGLVTTFGGRIGGDAEKGKGKRKGRGRGRKKKEVGDGGSSGEDGGKKKRKYRFWSGEEVKRLVEAVAMGGCDMREVGALVGTRKGEECRAEVRRLAGRVGGGGSGGYEECVKVLLGVCGVEVPRRVRDRQRVGKYSGSGDGGESKGKSRRFRIQCLPGCVEDERMLEREGLHPWVEILLGAHRPVSHIVKHLYTKWGRPLQLVTKEGLLLPLGSLVQALFTRKDDTDCPTIRLCYKFIKMNINEMLLYGKVTQTKRSPPSPKSVEIVAPAPTATLGYNLSRKRTCAFPAFQPDTEEEFSFSLFKKVKTLQSCSREKSAKSSASKGPFHAGDDALGNEMSLGGFLSSALDDDNGTGGSTRHFDFAKPASKANLSKEKAKKTSEDFFADHVTLRDETTVSPHQPLALTDSLVWKFDSESHSLSEKNQDLDAGAEPSLFADFRSLHQDANPSKNVTLDEGAAQDCDTPYIPNATDSLDSRMISSFFEEKDQDRGGSINFSGFYRSSSSKT